MKMKLFINPEDDNFFGGVVVHNKCEGEGRTKYGDRSYEEFQRESESKRTWWSSFKSNAKSLWERAKPIINGISSVLTVATHLMKVTTKFLSEYRNMKEAMA